MEVLIALSLMGLIFLLATDHLGTLIRGWFQMRELRSELTVSREIEATLTGFANGVESEVTVEAHGTITTVISSSQRLELDAETHDLIWQRQLPFQIRLPEPQTGWRLLFDEDHLELSLFDGDVLFARADINHRMALPCTFDAISRRCLAAGAQ